MKAVNNFLHMLHFVIPIFFCPYPQLCQIAKGRKFKLLQFYFFKMQRKKLSQHFMSFFSVSLVDGRNRGHLLFYNFHKNKKGTLLLDSLSILLRAFFVKILKDHFVAKKFVIYHILKSSHGSLTALTSLIRLSPSMYTYLYLLK